MNNAPLTAAELLALAVKPRLTLADIEQLQGRRQPDGQQLTVTKVAPVDWSRLHPGDRLALRVKDQAHVLSGEVVENRLAHATAPALQLRYGATAEVYTVRRGQLRDIRCLVFSPATT